MTTQAVTHPLQTIRALKNLTEQVQLLATMSEPESIYEEKQAGKEHASGGKFCYKIERYAHSFKLQFYIGHIEETLTAMTP